ncbi:integrin alpha-PS5-like [Bacillus rossius redtenbacheri]|uniref:integrin alpha-PS5-like n=1 Tax=Bacillus rossius redtenbacheri TaxID=93214 RepID=UPI002FDE2D65
MVTSMAFCHFTLLFGLSLTWVCVLSYNLDVKSAVLFQDPRGPKTRRSYFGFSVVLLNGTSSGSWLLVGAPRGNSSAAAHQGIVEQGVLFKCPMQPRPHNKSCEQYVLDASGNDESPAEVGISYHDHKDGAWIGAAMDIHSSGDDAEIIVCGHRWANEVGKKSSHNYFMLGICYIIYAKDIYESDGNDRGGTKTFLVSPKDEMIFFPQKDRMAYYYGQAQVGMCVHYAETEQGTVLLAGAPGVLNGRGGIMLNKRKFHKDTGGQQRRRRDANGFWAYEEKAQNITFALKSVAKYYDYVGYQVTSGKFFQGLDSYVASAPRADTLKGNVQLFLITPQNRVTFMRSAKVSGTQTGEHFGASVAVADVNGDHAQDLIVGAPMFAKKCDEGRVYIYHGSSVKQTFEPAGTKDGFYEKGRFGTAVVSLGDIDQDGYEDIAIGAPYEGGGKVYIYNGSPTGVRKDYSQRLSAEYFSPHLRGFGIAVSKPADVDNNQYSDVAVGSFLSDNVVLLRSHPVVKLRMRLTSDSKYLHVEDTNFTARLHLWFEGQQVTDVDVNYNVTIDGKLKRGYLLDGSVKLTTYKDTLKLESGVNYTREIVVKLDGSKYETKGFLEPIEILISADLHTNEGEMERENGDDFKKLLPVLHKYDSEKSYTLQVPLSADCGKGDCYCDLELTTHLKQLSNGVFVTGSSNTLDLEIIVRNKENTAFLTKVCIMLPSPVQLESIPKNCYEPQTSNMLNSINMTCDVANVMTKDMTETVTVRLDMTRVTHDFSMSVIVTTAIEDKNPANNFKEIMVNLVTEADVTIVGKDENGEHVYNGQYPNTSIVQHKYEVQKFKQSTVDEVEVSFNIPWLYHVAGQADPIKLLELYEPEATQNDRREYDRLRCHSDIPEFKQRSPEDEADGGEAARSKRSANESSADGSPATRAPAGSPGSVLYLNCSSNETTGVECRHVKCLTRPFTSKRVIARITLTMEVNVARLVPLIGKNGKIVFSTDGSVNITKPATLPHEANELTDYAAVNTAFYLYAPREEVHTKVYILAIIGGIFLLLLLILGLVKAGFFRRKTKEKLQSLLAENAEDSANVDGSRDNNASAIEEN